MLVKCDYCGKEFDKEPRRVNESKKNGWKLYCSEECKKLGRTTKVICHCAQCGKEIEKLPSQIKNSKNGNVFCSKSCAASYNNSHFRCGENNPNWKGSDSTKYALIAYRTYKPICAICGCEDVDMLEVHHIDENHDNNDIDNLIILCANHHSKVHRGGLVISQEIKDKREILRQ